VALAEALTVNRTQRKMVLNANPVMASLAEALTVNRTQRKMDVNANPVMDRREEDIKATLAARSYEAFGAMLRVNTNITLDLPTFDDAAGANERDTSHYNQMCIKLQLKKAR
jgi:hypothetical protein